MDIYELLKNKPEFELVNEFNLSARLLKEFDEDQRLFLIVRHGDIK